MKAHLLYRDQDFELDRELPAQADALTEDLDLETLLRAMAQGDRYLWQAGRAALFTSLSDPDAIVYRQEALRDCLAQPGALRELYDIAVEAVEVERRGYFGLFGMASNSPDSVLHSAVNLLTMLLEMLERLRKVSDDHAAEFNSEAFKCFFSMVAEQLDDDYLRSVHEHLSELALNHGLRLAVRLDKAGISSGYVLHRRNKPRRGLTERLADALPGRGYVYRVADRDEHGARRLGEIRGEGVNLAANAAAQSVDHIRAFFAALRAELGVYLGALNLHERLSAIGPTCLPTPVAAGRHALNAHELYEPCLALRRGQTVVGNSLDAGDRPLVVITGANQGGKSTFLRSVGVAQLMMQCGFFVAAESLSLNVCSGVFTHFKREEDATMTSGKFDEELTRMSTIADQAAPNALLLCNESFASTNEQEGSEIACQVVGAFLQAETKVLLVTHMYHLAHGLYRGTQDRALFLRALPAADGSRSYKLIEAEPLPTSYGQDIFRKVFGAPTDVAEPRPRALASGRAPRAETADVSGARSGRRREWD